MTTDDRELLQRLLDVEAIKGLKARYFRTLDEQDWDGFGAVFADDAVLEVPEVGMAVEGRAAIVDSVRAPLTGARTVHHGHMPEITVTGPARAEGVWAMFDLVEWPPGPDGGRVGITGYGHYREAYVRDGDGWRIARLRLTRLRVDPLAAAPPPSGPTTETPTGQERSDGG